MQSVTSAHRRVESAVWLAITYGAANASVGRVCVAHRGIASWIRAFIQLALLGIRARLASAPRSTTCRLFRASPSRRDPIHWRVPSAPILESSRAHMNENNVGSSSQLALAICEISYPPLEGDIHRALPSYPHAKRKAGAFRDLKHRLNSCMWVPLLLSAWLNSDWTGLAMLLHASLQPVWRRYAGCIYWRVLKTSDRGRMCSASRSQQYKWCSPSCPKQAASNRLRPLSLSICRASLPPAISLRLLLIGPRGIGLCP